MLRDMKIPSKKDSHIKYKVHREHFSLKATNFLINMCAPPSDKGTLKTERLNERCSLCTLRRGSLTVEAALILPFFLCILLGFFSFFGQYATAAELSVKAGAEAKRLGIVLNSAKLNDKGEITICKTKKPENSWNLDFLSKSVVVQKAVCRAWIGFEGIEIDETFVYITPQGSVYHLFRDCTHLKLSVSAVSLKQALILKNQNGKKYRQCSICEETDSQTVFITQEGDCYHYERQCSGLKRSVRYVPISEVVGRGCCMRCSERGM